MKELLLKYKCNKTSIEIFLDKQYNTLCCRKKCGNIFRESNFLFSELHPVFFVESCEKKRILPQVLGYGITLIFGVITLILLLSIFQVRDKMSVSFSAMISALIAFAGWGYAAQFIHRNKVIYFYSLWREGVILELPFSGKNRKILIQGAENIRELLLEYTKIPKRDVDYIEIENLYKRNLISEDELNSYISWYGLKKDNTEKNTFGLNFDLKEK